MKIVIEAMQDSEYVTGTDRLAYNVLCELQTLDTKNHYIIICRRGYDYISSAITAPNFKVVKRGLYRKRYWKPIIEPWHIIQAFYYKWLVQPNVYYSMVNLNSPRLKIAPQVTNALDLIPLIYTKQYHGTEADYQRFLGKVQATTRTTDRFIAISEHTKQDLVQYLEVKPEMTTVVYLAAEKKFQPVSDKQALAQVRKRYHLPEHFILTIGSNEPRKNVKTVLEAYRLLPESLRTKVALVILGGTWKGGSGKEAALGSLKGVSFTGFVDDDDLPALYSCAETFVFLSTYEGFGLPPLEAMACGLPVISSDATSLPEVTGDAAVLIKPTDTAATANALEQVLTDKSRLRQLKTASRTQAAKFTWRATAQQILGVLEEVGNRD